MILQRRAAVLAQSYSCVIKDCQNLFRLMFASFCVLFLVLEIKFFYI
ncbi:hypothetical protein SLEP1_g20786 [Rubroshorea leprosula]|uniref:Uncharacterized protein n=1 Tax=Rubroshorea leprosula TaxID=152421 RepID=A0AAV5JBD4_9ROSI|nr:hypothetical protein SLEP1_g20786 [Rubroshorea leprosula]